MYQQHRNFISPEDSNAKIWRYFDFTKFVSLLDKEALFFSRADKLEDSFEGALTRLDLEAEKEIREKFNIVNSKNEAWKKYVSINSWHLNNYESVAMWKLYLKSDEGIAIQTTFKSFCDSFSKHKDDPVYIGKVKYTDYENEVIPRGNIFNPFLNKRKSFEYENELRAIVCKFPPRTDQGLDFEAETIENGLFVKTDLDLLIHNIYISPYAKEWLIELVTSVTKKYGIKAKILPSDLNKTPYF